NDESRLRSLNPLGVYGSFTRRHLSAAGLPNFGFTTRSITLSAELLRISPETPDPVAIRYAAEFIRRGELVAIPTDTFYGIAADPFNLAAVDQIYRVKGRPET